MPSASSAARPGHRSRPTARPQPLRPPASAIRVRWDRLGRVALLLVFAAVALLYIRQGLSLLSTHSQAQGQLAIVQRLSRENARLLSQQRSLNDPATITRYARQLGMIRPGERPYVITTQSSR